MCDICSGSQLSLFSQRLMAIKKILLNHQPDLISLQELRTSSHLNFLLKDSPHLKAIHHQGFINYTDSVLVINTDKFKVLEQGHFWMGPQPEEFQFGWRPALPRILIWAKLMNRKSKQKFIFIGSHFDNLIQNLNGSAKMFTQLIERFDQPILFAGDTNITMDMPAFSHLTKKLNSVFNLQMKLKDLSQNLDNKQVCYRRKGKMFPDCIVEHILYDPELGLTPTQITIDTSSFLEGYPSDHRPIIVDFH
tara:strand:+ start:3833 stop:4579 length:747 start_codon:yes stop_codon:yes gene_type:complete